MEIKDFNKLKEYDFVFHTNDIKNIPVVLCVTRLKKEFDINNAIAVITMESEVDDDNIFIVSREEFIRILHDKYSSIPSNLITVTGTDGKTSTSTYIAQILSIGYVSCCMGSNKYKEFKNMKVINEYSRNLNCTTNELGKTLSLISGKDIGVIEASSIGECEGRLGNLKFNIGVFTSFRNTHGEYHKSEEDYYKAKVNILNRCNIVVAHEKIGFKEHNNIITFGTNNADCIYNVLDNNEVIVKYDGEEIKFNLKRHQFVENVVAAMIVAKLNGITISRSSNLVSELIQIKSRFEYSCPDTIVDHGHNANAFKHIVEKVNPNVVVFGCGGDRDKAMRYDMGKIASSMIETSIITSDNNRSETFHAIASDIRKGFENNNNDSYILIPRRYKAIQVASHLPGIKLLSGFGDDKFFDKFGNKSTDESYSKGIYFWGKENISKYAIESKITNFNYPTRIVFDTRSMNGGELFVCIDNRYISRDSDGRHGHNFLDGVDMAIVESKEVYDKYKDKMKNIIYVRDTMKTIIDYGKDRRKLITNAIAVTGTCGKTTTCRAISQILSDSVYHTESYNNYIGVGFSLANIDRYYDYGIFEIGSNTPGEIGILSNIINPDIGIITSIGPGHIGRFNSMDEIIKEKTSLNAKTMIVPIEYKKYYPNAISFGENSGDLYIKKIEQQVNNEIIVTANVFDKLIQYKTIMKTKSRIVGSLILFALQEIFKLDEELIINRIYDISLPRGRGNLININGVTILDHTFNANPMSVQFAIEDMLLCNGNRRILVLGDMKELGDFDSLKYINNISKVDTIFTYGDDHSFSTLKNHYDHYTDKNKLVSDLLKFIRSGDIITFKGSASMKMNHVMDLCIQQL